VVDRDGLPPEVAEHLDVLTDRLAELAAGADRQEVRGDMERAVENAYDAAQTAGAAQRDSNERILAGRKVTYQELVGDRIRRLRSDAGWTQQSVATAMQLLGFDWKRITVAEVERATRRTSLEEMTGIAALFAEPVLQLVVPGGDDYISFGDRTLDPADVAELWIGHDGAAGRGDAAWGAAARVAAYHDPGGDADGRPSRELWRRRRRGYGGRL
jgi:transcriptional regulator with XRE-family HTH domain